MSKFEDSIKARYAVFDIAREHPENIRFTCDGEERKYVKTIYESRSSSIIEQIQTTGGEPGVYSYITTGSFFVYYDGKDLNFNILIETVN